MRWEFRVTLLLATVTTPLLIYLMIRLRAALRDASRFSPAKRNSISIIPVLWYVSLPLLYLLSGLGEPFATQLNRDVNAGFLDFPLLIPFWIMLIITLESSPYFVAIDLANLIGRGLKLRQKPVWQRAQARAKVIIIVIISLYVSYRSITDTYHVNSRVQQIELENVPPEFDNLELVLFSDLQVDRFTQAKKLEQVSQIIEKNSRDFILFAGDLVTSGKKFTDQATEFVNRMTAQNRVAVLGDHDYWSDPERIPQKLRAGGWNYLQDAHKIFPYRGKKILITGITHIYSKKIKRRDLQTLLQNAPAADLKILLVHQPAEFIVELAAANGYQIMMAGHTHGGGIVSHIFGFPVTPSQKETRYYQGYFERDALKIMVTNGIGNTLSPLRYHAGAEVCILKITTRKPES